MSKLFERTIINGMELRNRFVRSATFEGLAGDDGSCTQKLIDLTAALAEGGVGLIFSGHAYVSDDGRSGRWKIGIQNDDRLPGLHKMAEAVHRHKGRMAIQLAHAGFHSGFGPDGASPMGPSAMEAEPGRLCRAMTVEDIHRTIDAFGQAAVRAKEAGFDGVQIHAAHGYLLSQFLSPFFNKRRDKYGGSIENRARIVLEIFERIRLAVGNDFPVMLKINSDDFLEKGLQTGEMIAVCRILEEAGVDAIEISGGTQVSGRYFPARPALSSSETSEDGEAYYLKAARLYKKHIQTPLMLVGGIRSYKVAKRIAEEGLADYIALSRPFIREPALINRWKSGDMRNSACRSDNLCLTAARAGQGIYCVSAEKEKSSLMI